MHTILLPFWKLLNLPTIKILTIPPQFPWPKQKSFELKMVNLGVKTNHLNPSLMDLMLGLIGWVGLYCWLLFFLTQCTAPVYLFSSSRTCCYCHSDLSWLPFFDHVPSLPHILFLFLFDGNGDVDADSVDSGGICGFCLVDSCELLWAACVMPVARKAPTTPLCFYFQLIWIYSVWV